MIENEPIIHKYGENNAIIQKFKIYFVLKSEKQIIY